MDTMILLIILTAIVTSIWWIPKLIDVLAFMCLLVFVIIIITLALILSPIILIVVIIGIRKDWWY